MAESPFQPGARVCVIRGAQWGDMATYAEDFVLKLYKNGNFTLKSNPKQQWSPCSYDDAVPQARMTGKGYHRPRLMLWNDEADAEIKANIADTQRCKRWDNVRWGLDKVVYDRVTDEALDLLERGIAALKPKKPTAT